MVFKSLSFHCLWKTAFVSALCVTLMLSGCSDVRFVPQPREAEPAPEESEPADNVNSQTDIAAAENPYLSSVPPAPKSAERLHREAISAMANKQWGTAEKLLQQLTADYPKLSGPYLNLGLVYRHTDRQPEAEQAIQKAIEVNANNLDAYNQLAILKREQGDFTAAESLYHQALAIWPQHADSHRNLGILYDLYMGQFDKALMHFETYQSLQPEPDPQLTGWIVDLKRRQNELAKAGQ